MKSYKMTYKELHDEIENNPNKTYYVKDHNGSLVPINAVGKKKSDTYIVEFENGYRIQVGDKHAFMNELGNPVTAQELYPGEKVLTLNGPLKVTSRSEFKENQDVYDINVPSPHWYTNDEFGIIHHNTMFALIMMKAYMDKYPDAVGLFYDSEFGASNEYFETVGIDTSRVFHEPVVHIEDLKFKIVQQLEQFERGDRVFILIDSIGNLASKKEAEDAKNQNSAADMSRAKEMKSLYRTTTPYLSKIGIPMVAINHSYKTMDFISKEVVSGGQGPMLSSDTVWLVGRRQDKKGQELQGYNFIIKIEKSRTVKEGAQIPVAVSFDSGVKKYSGLLDMALETGHVYKPKKGWYSRAIADSNGELKDDKNWREEEVLNSDDFWKPILEETDFKQKVKEMYELAGSSSIIEFEEELADTELSEEESPNEK